MKEPFKRVCFQLHADDYYRLCEMHGRRRPSEIVRALIRRHLRTDEKRVTRVLAKGRQVGDEIYFDDDISLEVEQLAQAEHGVVAAKPGDQENDTAENSAENATSFSDRGRYRIILLGDESEADTGADALAGFLRSLVTLDRQLPAKLSDVRGRVRPLIAETREALYPGRHDLAKFSREFVPGWFVGTNYSKVDVMRLSRLAAEKAGLVWGVDAYISKRSDGRPDLPKLTK